MLYGHKLTLTLKGLALRQIFEFQDEKKDCNVEQISDYVVMAFELLFPFRFQRSLETTFGGCVVYFLHLKIP